VGDTIVPHSMNYRKTRRQQISHNLKTNLCFQTKLIKVTCSLKAWLLCISPRFNPRARTHLCIGIDCSCVVFCSKSRICTLLRIQGLLHLISPQLERKLQSPKYLKQN
jgi:hypothetical protein